MNPTPTPTPSTTPTAPPRRPTLATSAWTGGQYSVARVLLGITLVARFVACAAEPRSSATSFSSSGPIDVALAVLGVLAAVLFAAGAFTRLAAGLLATLHLLRLDAATSAFDGSLLAVVVLAWIALDALALSAAAPFGSWPARGRIDPDGRWSMAASRVALLWYAVAIATLGLTIARWTHEEWRSGLAVARALALPDAAQLPLRELLRDGPPSLPRTLTFTFLGSGLVVAPLALFRSMRRIAFGVLLLHAVLVLPVARTPSQAVAGLAALAFLFDPAWLPPNVLPAREFLLYDGHCGLCHRLVRFVLAEDRVGLFTFTPLQGTTIATLIDAPTRAALPDSVVVRTGDGRLLVKSAAVIHLYDRLGGLWRLAAALLRAVPRPLRDAGYDAVAAIRHRLFAPPAEACPLLPPRLADRFAP